MMIRKPMRRIERTYRDRGNPHKPKYSPFYENGLFGGLTTRMFRTIQKDLLVNAGAKSRGIEKSIIPFDFFEGRLYLDINEKVYSLGERGDIELYKYPSTKDKTSNLTFGGIDFNQEGDLFLPKNILRHSQNLKFTALYSSDGREGVWGLTDFDSKGKSRALKISPDGTSEVILEDVRSFFYNPDLELVVMQSRVEFPQIFKLDLKTGSFNLDRDLSKYLELGRGSALRVFGTQRYLAHEFEKGAIIETGSRLNVRVNGEYSKIEDRTYLFNWNSNPKNIFLFGTNEGKCAFQVLE